MAVAAADDGLTDYERQRLAHVARNREYMARLGVLDLAKVVSSEKPTTAPSRKRVKREPTEPSRRSGRLLNVKPEHDGSAVDALRDDDDEEDAGERRDKRGTGRIATGPAGDASVWDSEDAALEASRQWLAHETSCTGGQTPPALWLQSKPSQPSWQAQRPLPPHSPWPPQSKGQRRQAHSGPAQPASHQHDPSEHTPWPEQLEAHSGSAQSAPP